VQARLDVLDAETEGQLGFILELELGNALPQRQVAALLTQVVVDPADPAFQHPTKQVGPHYSQEVSGQAGPTGAGRPNRGWLVLLHCTTAAPAA
jgi:carbamate kinase